MSHEFLIFMVIYGGFLMIFSLNSLNGPVQTIWTQARYLESEWLNSDNICFGYLWSSED